MQNHTLEVTHSFIKPCWLVTTAFFLNWFYTEKKCAMILKEPGVLKVEMHSNSICDFCGTLAGVIWIGYPLGKCTETGRLDSVSSTFATSSYRIWYHREKIRTPYKVYIICHPVRVLNILFACICKTYLMHSDSTGHELLKKKIL